MPWRSAMKLSELIIACGDGKVQFQNLDQCAKSIDYHHKKGTSITFGTTAPIGADGPEMLGLVVWLDRKAVKDALESNHAVG